MIVVFLDRDGVINYNKADYVRTADEFVFIPGALEGLARLKEVGARTIVISNQAGVGRGLIDPADLEKINRKMLTEVARHGGEIAGLYYCPHRRDEGCDCRKPEAGLFRQAGEEMGLPLAGSFLVGDAESDIQAGNEAGCRTILVLTGRSSIQDIEAWETRPEYVARNLLEAVEWLLSEVQGS